MWNHLDEVDLESTKDVNLSLARPHVQVHVGSTDFRKRFERALEILQAIKKGDSKMLNRFGVQDAERLIQNIDNINFIDATKSDRIVVNFAAR